MFAPVQEEIVQSPPQPKGAGMGEHEYPYKAGDLLNVKQVSEVLDVTEDWVRKLIRKGELQAVQLGVQYAIRWEDVKSYIEHR